MATIIAEGKTFEVDEGTNLREALLAQEVQHHEDAGERGLQFVAHGGDEIVLHVVEQAEPGDIEQHDGDANEFAGDVAHHQHARQVKMIPVWSRSGHCLAKIRRQEIHAI